MLSGIQANMEVDAVHCHALFEFCGYLAGLPHHAKSQIERLIASINRFSPEKEMPKPMAVTVTIERIVRLPQPKGYLLSGGGPPLASAY